MTTSTFFNRAGAMAVAGATTVGLALALAGPPKLVAMIVTVGLGAGALVWTALGFSQWWRHRLPGSGIGPSEVYSSRWAVGDADIAHAYEFFVGQLEEENEVSHDLMLLLQARNSQTLRLVERHRGAETRLMGIALMVPLSVEAETRIRRRDMRDPHDADIGAEALANWETNAAYIAGIAGSSERGRGYAMGICESWLREHGVEVAFARPVSRDGERVLRRWGFSPLGAPSKFWVWDVDSRPRRALPGA